ncbi:hypothetical protein [Hasllibacter sp. MH4015]|uniref:hypothetical protein n=1 Tax=Hasllibacter sp. MH4015 TaxID=2854029 RepID=UPI001CD73A10|nr:hypothetical protein [Hasllibacter sp. MH4015]
MFRPLLTATTLALTLAAAQATAQQCQNVQFPRGAYVHSVGGAVNNSYGATCYYLSVRRGQTAEIRVLGGPVYFTTNQTQDTYNSARFVTYSGDLYVYVFSDYEGVHNFGIEFAFY